MKELAFFGGPALTSQSEQFEKKLQAIFGRTLQLNFILKSQYPAAGYRLSDFYV